MMINHISYEFYFYSLALLAQLISIAIALKAFKNSGRYRYSWLLMSIVLSTILIGRLVIGTQADSSEHIEILEAGLTMATSIGMAFAIYGLKNIFSDLEIKTASLESLIQIDALTGALNRAGIMSHLEQEFQRANRSLKPVAVLMIDIDHFKRINDQYGHLVGDQVLQNLIICFQRSTREIDSIGRYGGEEFLIILPQTTSEQALTGAERIRKAVESATCAYAEKTPIKITISIGIATYDPNTMYPHSALGLSQEFIRRSDIAMYCAKESGRNRVSAWDSKMIAHQSSLN